MKMFVTTTLAAVFIVSMAAFILSFNACLSAQEQVIVNSDHTELIKADPTEENTSVVFFKSELEGAMFDKAELIVFNADGKVIYNEIIPSI